MTVAALILLLVTAERLVELGISKRNTRRLRQLGAVEHAPGHYPFIVALHAAWLAGLWVLAADSPVNLWWLAVFALLQGLRLWVLATLGARWTTRIIVLPGEALVQRGPYRFMSHPNYLVVIGEIAVLPLVFSMPLYALIFSILNAAVILVRVRAEDEALRPPDREARRRA